MDRQVAESAATTQWISFTQPGPEEGMRQQGGLEP